MSKKTYNSPNDKSGKGSTTSTGSYKRCYEDHPILSIGKGLLCGGSCSKPVVHDADVYVALDGFGNNYTRPANPWDEGYNPAILISHPLVDRSIPTDVPTFKKMVTWLVGQLKAGKKVHAGCMGGHGRTGLLLSAVVKEATEEEDAIEWVRKNYCKKAVESQKQVDFLHEHYGIKKAKASDSGFKHVKGGGNQFSFIEDDFDWRGMRKGGTYYPAISHEPPSKSYLEGKAVGASLPTTVKHLARKFCIFGKDKK